MSLKTSILVSFLRIGLSDKHSREWECESVLTQVDWLPTLLSATGKSSHLFNQVPQCQSAFGQLICNTVDILFIQQSSNNLDGVSLWNSLLEGQATSPRSPYNSPDENLVYSTEMEFVWLFVAFVVFVHLMKSDCWGLRWCTTLTRWMMASQ